MFGSTRKEFEPHDPDETLVREVGAHLRRARMARGEELEDVAEFLRIRPDYLHGLEQGDLSAMPGRTYALGFLRSYAQYLGFDGDDLIVQIRSSVAGLTGQAHLHHRTPLSESRLPKVPILVVSLAALAGVYAGWAYVDDSAEDELVVEVPDELRQEAAPPDAIRAPAVPGPPPPAAMPEITPALAPRIEPEAAAARSDPPASPPGAASGTAMPDADGVRPPAADEAASASEAPEPGAGVPADPSPPTAAISEPAPATAGQPAAGIATHPAAEVLAALAPVAGDTAPTIYHTADAASRVILRARSSAWVHVSSTSNDYLWVKTLRPGDAFVVPDRPGLVLWTGNAGGIEVIVDGTPLPPLGPEARVLRNVSLQPQDLLRRLQPTPAAGAASEP